MFDQLLSDDKIASIENFLQSDQLGDAHDYFGAHGFICGLAVSPIEIEPNRWLSILLDTNEKQLDEPSLKEGCDLLVRLKKSIDNQLYQGEKLTLPCPLTLAPNPDESPLRSWAVGFMETVFLDEERWFEIDEDTVGQLLLPIMLASGLHDDPELKQLEQDPKLGKKVLFNVPEVVIDLYILYRSGCAPEQ